MNRSGDSQSIREGFRNVNVKVNSCKFTFLTKQSVMANSDQTPYVRQKVSQGMLLPKFSWQSGNMHLLVNTTNSCRVGVKVRFLCT